MTVRSCCRSSSRSGGAEPADVFGSVRGPGLAGLPLEEPQKALDAIHELHRLPAARVTALGVSVPTLLRQQRQARAHIGPRIRILTLRLRDDAGVLEMTEAHVVGGHREPGA